MPNIRVRSFIGRQPCPSLDVWTGSNSVAALEAVQRAEMYGNWDEVQLDFGDNSRPMRGAELKQWVGRHFPEAVIA